MPANSAERPMASVHMDAIRGAAAILVMLGHSRDLFFHSLVGPPPEAFNRALHPSSGPPLPPPRPQITLGNEAVMIFFVLSGFLVGGSVLRTIQRQRWSWTEYLTLRLTRLWVVLLPALVLTAVMDRVGLHLFPQSTSLYAGPFGQSEVVPHLAQTLTARVFAGNIAFLQTIRVPTLGTNIPLWTLSNEFWYYILFPLVVLAVWQTTRLWTRVALVIAATLLLVFINSDQILLFPTWLLGAALTFIPLRLSDRLSRMLLIGLSLLLLPVMVLLRRAPLDLHVAQTAMALYFALMLYVILHRGQPARGRLYPRLATFVSDLSYPIYLVHVPILVFLCALANNPWHQWRSTPANFALMFALDCVPVAVAYLMHLGFQRNTDRVRRAILGRARRNDPLRGTVIESSKVA